MEGGDEWCKPDGCLDDRAVALTHAASGGRPPAASPAMPMPAAAAAAAAAPPPSTNRRCALLPPLVPLLPPPRPRGSKKGRGVATARAQALPGPTGFMMDALLLPERREGLAGGASKRLWKENA